MTSFEEHRAELQKQEDDRTVRVGEARGRVGHDIKKNGFLKIKIEKLEELQIISATELKKGDRIRVVIDKV